MTGLRRQTELPDGVERLATRVIGCAIAVHRSLGPGLVEKLYEEAMAVELEVANIPAQRQARFDVVHRDRVIGLHVIDLLIDRSIVVELKSTERLNDLSRAQTISYLRIADAPLGLIINFNSPVLKDGIIRIFNPMWSGLQRADRASATRSPHSPPSASIP